jgi:F-type H+-transporting ATPase subunit gamma
VASLRETKDRIGSVRSTLKITSAMKLVASAKLRKAQKAIEGMRPYERTLAEILAALPAAAPTRVAGTYFSDKFAEKPISAPPSATPTHAAAGKAAGLTAIVAIASNSSLCGGFNANVIRKALETIRGCEGAVEVYPIGRKMTDALRRAGYTCPTDYNDLIGHPGYDKTVALARQLSERYQAGELSRVILVYTRFVSASRQEPVAESYLPMDGRDWSEAKSASADRSARDFAQQSWKGLEGAGGSGDMPPYLMEPDAEALVAQLLPQVLMLKFYAAILDSAAAEQAARTLAMQTATDNAEDLLGELTLEYNKGRQQKITAEILDLLGGAAE